MKKLMLMVVAMLFVVSSASAGGGVDEMQYDGGWNTVVDSLPGTYVSLTADATHPYLIYGAKAGGGVDEMQLCSQIIGEGISRKHGNNRG